MDIGNQLGIRTYTQNLYTRTNTKSFPLAGVAYSIYKTSLYMFGIVFTVNILEPIIWESVVDLRIAK